MNRESVMALGVITSVLSEQSYLCNMDLPKFRKASPVRHSAECPVCGKHLVNIYNRNGTWKCLKCWNGGGD